MEAVAKLAADRSRTLREQCLLAVLGPVFRIALRNGLDGPEVLGLAREALIDAAKDHSRGLGIEPRVSRISIDAGLTQSEVTAAIAIRTKRAEATETRRRMDELVAAVASAWMTDPRFSGPYGTSLPLRVDRDILARADPSRGEEQSDARIRTSSGDLGGEPSYAELIKLAAPNSSAEDVLVASLERNVVSWSHDQPDCLVLSVGFKSVQEQGADPTFEYVMRTLAGLARTLAANAYGLYRIPKLFERRAIGDRALDAKSLRAVNDILRSKLSVVLESVVDELEAPKATIDGTPEARCSIGVFVMAESLDIQGRLAKQSFLREIDLASSDARSRLNEERFRD